MFTKKAVLFSVLAAALFQFGCHDVQKYTLTRTYDDGQVIAFTSDVPVYKRVCETRDVWGRHPSCGYDHFCRWVHYPPHHPYYPTPRWVCYDEMRSCYHPETLCEDRLDHTSKVTLNLNFDERAKLAPGEKEEIELAAWGTYEIKTVRAYAKKSRYTYEFAEIRFNADNNPEISLHMVVKSKKLILPTNDIDIISAQYTDAGHFEIVFSDPKAGDPTIEGTLIRVKVMGSGFFERTFGKNFIDGLLDLEFAQPLGNGKFKFELDTKSSEWKGRPDQADMDRFMVRYSVQRVGELYRQGFSDVKSVKFFR